MPTYLTKGIVLTRQPYRESDRLYSILTQDRGTVTAVVRSARKTTSKLASHLEAVGTVELMLATTRGAYERIAGARILRFLPGIQADITALGLAQYYLHVTSAFCRPGMPATGSYERARGSLDMLEATLRSHPRRIGLVTRAACLELLAESGFAPQLHACVHCGGELSAGEHQFDAPGGGLRCGACRLPEDEQCRALSDHAVKLLRVIRQDGPASCLAIRMRPEHAAETGWAASAFVRACLEFEPAAERFMAAIQAARSRRA